MSSFPLPAPNVVVVGNNSSVLDERHNVTVLLIIIVTVSITALSLFVAAFYYYLRAKRQRLLINHSAPLAELGVNHIQAVTLKWFSVAGIDVDYYEEDDRRHLFFTADNFDAFHVDIVSKRMALRIADSPSLFTSVWWDHQNGGRIQQTGPGFVAVYEGVPIYYDTFGLSASDSLQNNMRLLTVVEETEFLRIITTRSI